jgi:predicted HicB family RNase H-like nuclease
MSHLRYKDYQGSVTFVENVLLIQIMHIDDLITTECDSAANAQAAFQELVDDYIQTCAEMNKSPSKPFKGSFNVRVPPSLHRSIAMLAAQSGDTMNSWIQKTLEEKVERNASYRRLAINSNFLRMFQTSVSEHWSKEVFEKRGDVVPVLQTSARSLYEGPFSQRLSRN